MHGLRTLALFCLVACACHTSAAVPAAATGEQLLLVSGSVTALAIMLNTSYFLETKPAVPDNAGPFAIEGLDASGRSLFRFCFTPKEVADVVRVWQFTFAIPVTVATRDALATVRVTGPQRAPATRTSAAGRKALLAKLSKGPGDPAADGGFAIERSSGDVVRLRYDSRAWAGVMISDPDTREVLAFGNDGTAAVLTSKKSLRLVFSDGVQSAPQLVTIPR